MSEKRTTMPQGAKLRLPPQNTEAEQSVLGSLLIDPHAIIKVADTLTKDDFYNPMHRVIYSAVLDLYEKRKPVDLMSITTRLKEKKALASAGGSSYLAELTNLVATSSHVGHYAQVVKEKRVLRDLIKASAEITEDAFETSQDVEELLDGIEQKILAISQKSLPQNFTPLNTELKTAYERIERLHQGKEGALRGIPTGFHGLDNILSGLQKSNLIIVGGRPSIGKTSFALDIARHVAVKANLPVGFFSLEMSRDEVVDRVISAESSVPLWKLRTGKISDDTEFQMIQGALDRLSHAHFFIDDTPSLNVLQMRSMARRLQVEHGLGLLLVDYLQLITPRSQITSMVQQITEISRGLKALARELQVPVIAMSQLSREVEKRDRKVPRLSDLRESGSIEQDADVVLFLYRREQSAIDATSSEENIMHVNVSKHRNGPPGSVALQFDGECATFRNLERRLEDNEMEF